MTSFRSRRRNARPAITRSGGLLVAWKSAVALVLVAVPAARGADISGELEKLFELGAKSTPSAISAARAQYEQLKKVARGDARIDYAYGVVLVHQHKYHDALPLLDPYLAKGESELDAQLVKLWTQVQDREYTGAFKQAAVVGKRLTRAAKDQQSKPGDAELDAARMLGTIFEYLEVARPTAVDAKLRAKHKAALLAQLGDAFTPAFAEGVTSVTHRLDELQQKQQTKTEELTAKDKTVQSDAQAAANAEQRKIETIEQRQKRAAKELADIQPQLATLQDNYNQLTLQVNMTRQQIRQMEQAQGGHPQAAILKSNLRPLEKQQKDVEHQLHTLQQKVSSLSGTHQQANRTLGVREKLAMHEAKRAKDAADRLRSTEAKAAAPRAAILSGPATMLSTYSPFPYEQEQERVLSWFAK